MKVEKLSMIDSVFTTFAASLCCILPLVFSVLGVGAFGAAAAFETARPFLLSAATLLLAFGFYSAYFRREEFALRARNAALNQSIAPAVSACGSL
jgi:hypothetical protein